MARSHAISSETSVARPVHPKSGREERSRRSVPEEIAPVVPTILRDTPIAGGPGRPLSGGRAALRGNKNKRLTAFSNRNSNDSRKLATLSESTTSNFYNRMFLKKKRNENRKRNRCRGEAQIKTRPGRMHILRNTSPSRSFTVAGSSTRLGLSHVEKPSLEQIN
jgi:hypothetical protein